jgi:hypothetical protein
MIRVALAALTLSGCTLMEHAQVLPTFSSESGVGCCVLLVEPSRSTSFSLTLKKSTEGLSFKAGSKWRF